MKWGPIAQRGNEVWSKTDRRGGRKCKGTRCLLVPLVDGMVMLQDRLDFDHA